MSFIQLKQRIDDLMAQEPMSFPLPLAPASDEEITELQRRLNVSLPADYVTFLKVYGGGQFAEADLYTVEEVLKWNSGEYEKSSMFVGVSPDGSGNEYGFRVVNGMCQPEVWFWDHEGYEEHEIEPTEINDFCEFMFEKGVGRE